MSTEQAKIALANLDREYALRISSFSRQQREDMAETIDRAYRSTVPASTATAPAYKAERRWMCAHCSREIVLDAGKQWIHNSTGTRSCMPTHGSEATPATAPDRAKLDHDTGCKQRWGGDYNCGYLPSVGATAPDVARETAQEPMTVGLAERKIHHRYQMHGDLALFDDILAALIRTALEEQVAQTCPECKRLNLRIGQLEANILRLTALAEHTRSQTEREPCGHFQNFLLGDEHGHFNCQVCRAEQAEEHTRELREALRGKADKAYCDYIEQMRHDECLGHISKLARGTFGKAELDAHKRAAELYGRHKALAEAALAAGKE